MKYLLHVSILVLALSALALVGARINNFGIQNNQLSNQSQQEVTQSTVDTNKQTFTHPTANYSFTYPANWTLESEQPAIGMDTQLQLDITIKSPDYALTTEGIQTLEKGAEVFIYRAKTDVTSIDEKFEQDRFTGQIANSKTETTVDGQKAIQYDYSFESVQATDTVFIKNGTYFLVKLQYADENEKSENFPHYLDLLQSFKAQ